MKEMFIARAHVAEPNTKMKTFQTVASRLKATQRFIPVHNGCILYELFNSRLKSYLTMRNADEVAMGAAYEYIKVEKILKKKLRLRWTLQLTLDVKKYSKNPSDKE